MSECRPSLAACHKCLFPGWVWGRELAQHQKLLTEMQLIITSLKLVCSSHAQGSLQWLRELSETRRLFDFGTSGAGRERNAAGSSQLKAPRARTFPYVVNLRQCHCAGCAAGLPVQAAGSLGRAQSRRLSLPHLPFSNDPPATSVAVTFERDSVSQSCLTFCSQIIMNPSKSPRPNF